MPVKKQVKKQPIEPTPDGRCKPAEKQEFIRFVALPKIQREKEYGFPDLKDFAKKYKVNVCTLSDWQKDSKFWKEVKKLWRTWGKNRTPDVLYALFSNASKAGRSAEVKTWFELIEEEDLVKRIEKIEDELSLRANS